MSLEANKVIFTRMINELFNDKNLAAADELFLPTATVPNIPDTPPGPEGARQIAGPFISAFPDLEVSIDFVVAEGDRVFGRMTERATHQGTFFGIPASQKRVEFTEMGIVRIEDGKIAESWFDLDLFSLMMQIMPQQNR
ncbi:MAG TPA: ester cyclase [Ktedonosporobacter sp.]|nr:ester cyclase [Ktedonosporobacter sp.]